MINPSAVNTRYTLPNDASQASSTRPRRATDEPTDLDTYAPHSRAEGDSELAALYRIALEKTAGPSAPQSDLKIDSIPASSTFGQWWSQLGQAFQSPDVQQWMQERGIRPSSIKINPASGQITFSLETGPGTEVHTLGLDDPGWAAVSGPILNAGRIIVSGYTFTTFAPPLSVAANNAPFSLVQRFYKEPELFSPDAIKQRVAELLRDKTFVELTPPTFTWLHDSRSEDRLEEQQAQLADIRNRYQAALDLRHLAGFVREGKREESQIAHELDSRVVYVDSSGTYTPSMTGNQNSVSLKQFIEDHGWKIPATLDQLDNLVTALMTPAPKAPVNGNYGGARAWPEPLDAASEQHLRGDILQGKAGDIDFRPSNSLLEYLLEGHPTQTGDPRQLIDRLIESPKGQAVGRAIQAQFEARSVKGSVNDWLLAALTLDLSAPAETAPGTAPTRIAGYTLLSAENTGKTAATVVSELSNVLAKAGKGSSPEHAALQATLMLSSRAPEFLVKDIPKDLALGTHSWVSFATAVARIEAKSPGATSSMTYAQVMLEASTAPISDEESIVEYAAQTLALKEWAVANGNEYPSSDTDMAIVRKRFTDQINVLKEAARLHVGEMPKTRDIALEQLKKALPGMDPKLFEQKCITVEPSHKRFPGPYSLLDAYIDGRPLFWTPNRANFWEEESRNITNLFKSAENEQASDSRPGAWVSSSSAFNFDEVRETLKHLPRPKALFTEQFSHFANALKKNTTAQFKALIAKLPLEDRLNLQLGKVTIGKEETYHRPDHPIRQEDGVLLVRTERDGKVMNYAIDRLKGTITRRPDQTYKEYAPRNGTLPQPGKRFDEVKPAGEHASGITEEIKNPSVVPDSFSSARTQYIVDAILEDMSWPDVELYAKGTTTFDTQVPLHKQIEQIVLALVPFKSGIENLINGDIKRGLVELFIDALGFVVGVGAVAKGAKGFAVGASALSKVAHVTQIIGRAAIGGLNPLNGVDDLARGAIRLVGKAAHAGFNGIQGLRAHRSVNLLELAKKPDIAQGTYKAFNRTVDSQALAKFDEATSKWYAVKPGSGQAYGKPLDNFVADVPGSGTSDSLQALGSADGLKRASQHHGLAASGRFKIGQETVEGNAVMFQGNWHAYDAIKKQPYGPPLRDFTPARVAAGGEVRPVDTTLLGYEAQYIAADELSTKGLQGNIYVGRSQKEYVKIDGVLYESRLKEGQRVIVPPKGKGPAIPIRDLGASGWEPSARSARLLGGTHDTPLRWKLGDSTYVVPMDDIKVAQNSPTPFTLTYKGEHHNVIFDSAAGAWKKEPGVSSTTDPIDALYFWRSGKGKWQRGSFKEFLKAKKQDAHQYAFVDVVPSSAIKIPSDVKPLPKNLHYFWAGQAMPPKLMDNLVNNAAKAPGYKSILHVDADTPAIFQQIKQKLESKAPGLEVRNLQQDDVFKQLQSDGMYDYFRQGQGRNLAATSDVARYPIMNKYGGFYLDTDDVIKANAGGDGIIAGPKDVLLNRPVAHSLTGYKPFYNTSNFGTQANNPVITDMIIEMKKRFAENKAYFMANRPTATRGPNGHVQYTPEFNAYERKIFETVGPTLFNDNLKLKRPDMYDLGFDGITKQSKVVDGKLVSHGPTVNIENDIRQSYLKQGIAPPDTLGSQLSKAKEHYFPLRHKLNVEIGAEHSWIDS